MSLEFDPENHIVCPYCGGAAIMTDLTTGKPVLCPRCDGRRVIPKLSYKPKCKSCGSEEKLDKAGLCPVCASGNAPCPYCGEEAEKCECHSETHSG